jgi:hypothetical protein
MTATDFHSKGGEVQRDVRELIFGDHGEDDFIRETLDLLTSD